MATELTPEQWRHAAQWLRCRILHSDGLDDLGDEPMHPVNVAEHVVDLFDDAIEFTKRGVHVSGCGFDD